MPAKVKGQYEDIETGLYYNRFRYYDPLAGQYISQDPIGLAGGRQLQGYVADPLTQVDVFGLSEGSGTLGNRMVRAGMDHGISPFPKSNFRAHHVIPHEVWTNNQQFFDDIGLGRQGPSKAFPRGLNPKDAAANGVFMPKSEAVGQQYGFEHYHNGSHGTFNADMRANVVDVRDRFRSGAITRTQARKEISALQKAERKRLSKRGPVNGPCDQLR
jgi:RHS repeat-associated protein